ncbi:OmpA family protein [Reichenbachiella sp.]|uniref:OmpA family protein n=1 Tax=Reichenbachiella sp. TaxID=2184521 RepID=UPI00329773A7
MKIMASGRSLFVWFIFSAMLFYHKNAYSQERLINRGIKYFERGNYATALAHFESNSDSIVMSNELVHYMSQSYLELHQPQKAKELIEKLSQMDEANTYNLIRANYQLEDFSSAMNLVNQSHHLDDPAFRNLKNKIGNTMEHYDNKKGYIVQNFGSKVNSTHREYSSVIFNHYNTLLFTSRKDSTKKSDIDGLSFETIYKTTIDSNNNWTLPKALATDLVKDKRHDATVQIFSNGKKMISYHDGKLYSSFLKDNVWQIESEFNFHNQLASDTHCFITTDEKTIYFASDFQSTRMDLDLYMSHMLEDGKWSEPEPLSELNTDYDEDSPFLADDGTFYFSSRGHNSIGGYDIFRSSFNEENGSWSKPINLGYPINSVGEDTYYSVHGKVGYLTSSRLGGYGSLDLYRLFLFNKVKIEGHVASKNGQIPLANVEIDLEYDSLFIRSYTDINGNYSLYMPINKEMHVTFIKDSLDIHEDDYIVNVSFKDQNNNEFNFFIGANDSEPKAIANLNTHPKVKEINIDIKNDFEENPFIAVVPNTRESYWVDSLNLVYEKSSYSQNKSHEMNSIVKVLYFDYDQYELSNSNQKLLDSLCESSLVYNNVSSVHILGHTDSRGGSRYNQQLSWQRANAVYEYILDKKILINNFLVKGVGAKKPIMKGDNEASHSENRRVEITFHQYEQKNEL